MFRMIKMIVMMGRNVIEKHAAPTLIINRVLR